VGAWVSPLNVLLLARLGLVGVAPMAAGSYVVYSAAVPELKQQLARW
jgi:hypothetical protein